jgi:hypothetical protein
LPAAGGDGQSLKIWQLVSIHQCRYKVDGFFILFLEEETVSKQEAYSR